jgi:hypothetical protein
MSGISGTRAEGADSIVVSGGYEDDEDFETNSSTPGPADDSCTHGRSYLSQITLWAGRTHTRLSRSLIRDCDRQQPATPTEAAPPDKRPAREGARTGQAATPHRCLTRLGRSPTNTGRARVGTPNVRLELVGRQRFLASLQHSAPGQVEALYVYEGRFGDVHREDQDINAWVEQIPDRQDVDRGVWVQVHSADDSCNHPELDRMAGRRVRVRIELQDG